MLIWINFLTLNNRFVKKDLIKIAREGGGPGFIEAVTYRWLGHVGADPNIDVGLRRSQDEIKAWKNLDPIKRLKEAMISAGEDESKSVIKEELETEDKNI